MGRYFNIALITLVIAVVLSGCYRNRNAAHQSKPYQPPPDPAKQLEEVPINDRAPIQVNDIGLNASGSPVNADAQNSLRRLTVAQCRELAMTGSRNANALDAEFQRLQCNENVPPCILEMIQLSAMHQRNESIGQALEAYLNLVEVYLQHDLLLESTVLIDDTHQTIDQLRAADVIVDFDRRELDRRRMTAEEKAFELLSNQQTLTTGLELLLQLQRTSGSPIWPEYSAESFGQYDVPTLNDSLTVAWENRKDLRALQALATCCSEDLIDAVRSSLRSIHPLLGFAFRPRGVLYQAFFGQQDDLHEVNQLQNQVYGVIESLKDSIELEVASRVYSIEKRMAVIRLKKARIQSLHDSIQSAKDVAAVKPVDLKAQVERRAQVIEARSELIRERIALEIDRVKLMQAQGILN